MSIIEISRIQVRRGQENQTGVPQLAGGEFAWAADTEKLYIGLRREDGGSRDANVEILTENSLRNFFSSVVSTSTNAYTYREGTYLTAIDGFNEYQRRVEQKLDDIVSIRDFGVLGNSNLDDTTAIQIAIDNLFLNSLGLTPAPVKALYFPAGVYNISTPIYIPAHTTIIGEGIDKTIFNLTTDGNRMFQTVDSRSPGYLYGNYVIFTGAGTIDSNTQPDYVYIEGATLRHDASTNPTLGNSLISLDCSNYAVVKNVKFKGNYYAGLVNKNYAAIDIRGYQAVTSESVIIENCEFDGLCVGVKSNHDIVNPAIHNSRFNNLYKGISFCDPIDTLGEYGPRLARITNNRFENVAAEAIYVGATAANSSTGHISMNNQFFNVGNDNNLWAETSTTGTAVITFVTKNNSSVNDYFDRYDYQMRHANEEIKYKPLISGNALIESQTVSSVVINTAQTLCVARLPITDDDQFLNIRYSIKSGSISRKGFLRINIPSGINPTVNFTDDYNYQGFNDADITWSFSVNQTNKWIELRASNAGSQVTIEHQLSLLL